MLYTQDIQSVSLLKIVRPSCRESILRRVFAGGAFRQETSNELKQEEALRICNTVLHLIHVGFMSCKPFEETSYDYVKTVFPSVKTLWSA